MQILEKMQKTHAADNSTSAKGFEATSTGCGTTNSDAMNNCGTVITRKTMGKVLSYGIMLFVFMALSLRAEAQTVAKQSLDSIVNPENYKFIFSYDSRGNNTGLTKYSWSNGNWTGSSKYEYAYDNNGNRTMYTSYWWYNNDWIRRYKEEFTYDNNGNRTMYASYNWNNTTWVGSEKWESSYDNSGNQTLFIYYNWENNTWIKSNKSEYAYDNNNNQTLYVSYYWCNNDWVGSYGDSKWESTYDNNSNQTMYASYHWNNNDWVGSEKWESTYNSDGNQIIKIEYGWNSVNNTWREDIKTEYAYDNNKELKTNELYSWDATNSIWKKYGDGKYEYTYDNKENPITRLYSFGGENNWRWVYLMEWEYDSLDRMIVSTHYVSRNGSTWEGYEKFDYLYDNNNKKIKSASYIWNNTDSAWIGANSKEEFIYDSKGNRTMYAFYYWSSNNTWKGNYKGEYTYNDKGLLTMEANYDWDNDDNDWIIRNKWEFIYDNNDNITTYIQYNMHGEYYREEYVYDLSYSRAELLIPVGMTFSYTNNKPIEEKSYKMFGTAWEELSIGTYYWSAKNVTGIVETHCNASLRVYPNPAGNQLTIDCRDVINHVSTVEIYDVVGQTVGAGFKPAPTNAKNEITIDISHLAAGMYFLKIGNRTARFVKE